MSISVLKAVIDFSLREAFKGAWEQGDLYNPKKITLSNGNSISTKTYNDGVVTHLYDPEKQVRTVLQLSPYDHVSSFDISQFVGPISDFRRGGPFEDTNVHSLNFTLRPGESDLSSIRMVKRVGEKVSRANWSNEKPDKLGNFKAASSQSLTSTISDFYCASMIGIQHGQMPDFSNLQSVVRFPLIAKDDLPNLLKPNPSARVLAL